MAAYGLGRHQVMGWIIAAILLVVSLLPRRRGLVAPRVIALTVVLSWFFVTVNKDLTSGAWISTQWYAPYLKWGITLGGPVCIWAWPDGSEAVILWPLRSTTISWLGAILDRSRRAGLSRPRLPKHHLVGGPISRYSLAARLARFVVRCGGRFSCRSQRVLWSRCQVSAIGRDRGSFHFACRGFRLPPRSAALWRCTR